MKNRHRLDWYAETPGAGGATEIAEGVERVLYRVEWSEPK
jgi:hypothetical protein